MATASIVVLDASGKALRQTDDWSADIAYGADEQRFTISRIAGAPLAAHMRWQVDGTALAGVVVGLVVAWAAARASRRTAALR